MPDAYELHDGAFVQLQTNTSAANGLSAIVGPVPAGKIWTVMSAVAAPSVAETQIYWFALTNFGVTFPVTLPASIALAPAVQQFYPLVREGMELKMFPGEYLTAYRAAATAASTISIYVRLIETDLPFYVELDKHKVLRRRARAMEITNPNVRIGGSPPGILTGRPTYTFTPPREGREK